MALDTLPPDVKEKLFEAVLNNSYHGIVALDAIPDDTGAIEDFRYFYVNLTAEKILHRKADELMGNRFLDVFPGIKDEGLFDTFVQVANTGRTVQFENEYRRDGLDASFEISVSQFRNGIVISFIETTEQTKMSRRLKKLSDRLKIATETAEVGIWEYDVKNDKLIWDDVMHRIFDVSKDKFEGTFESWAKTVHPADIDAAKANFSNALGENSDFHTNFRIIHPDGNIRWIEARARVEVDENGKPVRAIGTNWDFTDMMNAYEELAVAK